MRKIYQKMYLTQKSRSEGVLGGFTLIELLVVSTNCRYIGGYCLAAV